VGNAEHTLVSWGQVIPRLRAGVRLCHDQVRAQDALLHPEGVALLNTTAAATLALVDGKTSLAGITQALSGRFRGVREKDVVALLAGLEEARLVALTPSDPGSLSAPAARPVAEETMPRARAASEVQTFPAARANGPSPGLPLGLLAELTHRCPLHCPYCSNPLELTAAAGELPTSTWLDILGQARAMGVLQVHLSGGEPLLRRDVEPLAAGARGRGMYVNLVTSGVGLSDRRARALADVGVDHVQLSMQGADAVAADVVAGAKTHQRKLQAAAAVRAAGMVLTINIVLHRRNATDIEAVAELAASLEADRLELAHAQFYGWALRNRASLLPSESQVRRSEAMVRAARAHYPHMAIIYVASDYYEKTPKPCMNGWGSRQLTITPDGTVLPCPAATVIRDLNPPNIADAPLAHIWAESSAFIRFRGTSWLPEPCHSCPARDADFGGCRCQAYQLLGDAGATDPVCQYSPARSTVDAAIATASEPHRPLIYRTAARTGRNSLRQRLRNPADISQHIRAREDDERHGGEH
jgi:pyrroloquinoline quinone biosynthesis protein E